MGFAIDTLAYARRLREAGFTEQQAEGQAEALVATMTQMLATKSDLQALATKQDLHDAIQGLATKQELREAVQGLATKQELREAVQGLATTQDLQVQVAILRGEMADLERRMTIRLGGIMVAGIGFLSALI